MADKIKCNDIALIFMVFCLITNIAICCTFASVVHSYFYSPADYSFTTTNTNNNTNGGEK